jgi:hypothetical protein
MEKKKTRTALAVYLRVFANRRRRIYTGEKSVREKKKERGK